MCEIYIPADIRELLNNQDYCVDSIGCSDSKVLLFKDKVLKIQPFNPEVSGEYLMMKWLSNKIPVPKCIFHLTENGVDYLLMTRLFGKMSCDDSVMCDPKRLVKILAEGLKQMWQVDIKDCPIDQGVSKMLNDARIRLDSKLINTEDWSPIAFGECAFETPEQVYDWLVANKPLEELVLSHGDYCLPNVMIDENGVAGFIDLGHSGVADKWKDIALCYRSLKSNYCGRFAKKVCKDFDASIFFEALGIEPNWEKINYYILLDELF